MPVIQTPSKSIDRKSQTFTQTGNGGGSFVRQVVQAVQDNAADITSPESMKDAANKMGFLMKMINVLKTELLCKLAHYEVICHAQDIPTAFSVPDNTLTIIPFYTLVYTPSDGSYSAATGFTAGRAGYYDVDAAFQNYSLTTPVVRVFMNIGTSAGITYQVDDVIMGTEIMRVQGSMKIWCDEGDSIRAYLLHQAGVGILFNTLAHPGASGYISISYAGSEKAAKRG